MALKRNKYKDILIIVIGFMVIGYFFDLPYMIYAAWVVGLLSAFFEKAAEYVAVGWEKLGMAMGMVSTTILLSILFFLILTPLAIIRGAVNRNTARSDDSTNWESAEDHQIDFLKQW